MPHMFSDISAFRRDPLTLFRDVGEQATAPLVKLNLGPRPVYLVTDPGLIKPIFTATEQRIDKGWLVKKMSAIIGKNSLTMSGPLHQARRAAIHAQLSRGVSSSYVPSITAIIREAIVKMVAVESFEAHQTMSALALRVICDTLFGRGALSSGDEAALINAIKLVEDDLAGRMFQVLPDLPWTAIKKRQRMKTSRKIMLEVVERARRRSPGASILQSLNSLKLSNTALRDEVLLIMLAGHHTTGSAAAWLLYHLATTPSLAAKLAEEAAIVTDVQGDISPVMLNRAKISRATAFEILRLYPSAYWYARETKQSMTLAGIKIRTGTSLIVSPWHLHRDGRYWIDPLKFDLNRAHLANKAFVPFGTGPRACVGLGLAMMELQILALQVASSCELIIKSATPLPNPKPSITLVPPAIEIGALPHGAGNQRLSRLIA